MRWRMTMGSEDEDGRRGPPSGASPGQPERDVARIEPGRSARLGRAGQSVAWRLADEARSAGGRVPIVIGEMVEGGLSDCRPPGLGRLERHGDVEPAAGKGA